jgi:putative SOS response-associated peptidase YedK
MKADPVEGEHELFGFLTTDANAEVGAIHPKAMPVIFTRPEDIESWLTFPIEGAFKMQAPFPRWGSHYCGAWRKGRWPPAELAGRLL